MGKIVEEAFNCGIRCVSLWVGSYSNLVNRSKAVLKVLDAAYEHKFNQLANDPVIQKEQVQIEVIGDWRNLLSKRCIAAAERAIEVTKNYSRLKLVVLVGYDGVRERGQAVLSLLSNPTTTQVDDPPSANQLLRSHAATGHLPDVDLIVRTGAWEDPHNSAAFLSFLTSESQYAFPRVLWPDFTPQLLRQLVDDFARRERRFGK